MSSGQHALFLQREPWKSCPGKFSSRYKAGFLKLGEVVDMYLDYVCVQKCPPDTAGLSQFFLIIFKRIKQKNIMKPIKANQ